MRTRLTTDEAIAELSAYSPGWIPESVGRYGGLIDDVAVYNRALAMLGHPKLYWRPFVGVPVTRLLVAEATHSSQDGYDRNLLLHLLQIPVPWDEAEVLGVILAVRMREGVLIYDANHRFAAARMRGAVDVPAREVAL